MKKKLVAMIGVMVLCGAFTAHAQEQAMQPQQQPQMQEKTAQPAEPKEAEQATASKEEAQATEAAASLPLENRFKECLKPNACSIEDRLVLMKEMSDQMNQQLDIIARACSYLEYKHCVDPQQQVVQDWHRDHENLQRMMLALQVQSLGQMEPSAGGATAPQKTWWEKLWEQK